jgi:hypothetical protein
MAAAGRGQTADGDKRRLSVDRHDETKRAKRPSHEGECAGAHVKKIRPVVLIEKDRGSKKTRSAQRWTAIFTGLG